jgi:crotonobetainyl-CoA:carnitine CoA-transferase CaiB-like acyl-CoA transferase
VLVAVDDRNGGTVPLVQSPFRFTTGDVGARGVPAYRGEHNGEVLRELGFGDDEIAGFDRAGVISSRPPRPQR